MTETTRQKYMDAMQQRADLIKEADAAFAEGNTEKGVKMTNQAKALNESISGYQALLVEEERYAKAAKPAMNPEQRDKLMERANLLITGKGMTLTLEEVKRGLFKSTTLATSTLVEPQRAGTVIHDSIGPVSSILDMVTVVDLSGCTSIKEPIVTAEQTAQAGTVASTAGTARTASDPTFTSAQISPYNVDVTSYVDKNLSRLSPVNYFQKVQELAFRAMRRKVATFIYNGDSESTHVFHGIKNAADTGGTALYKTVTIDSIAAGWLDKFVFEYGGNEEIGSSARLFLNRADLKAIGALRGSDSKRVYEIIPDPANANIGRIVDGGLVVPYVIASDLTALSTSTQGASAIPHMVYGDPRTFELGLFGPMTINIDPSVKAVERMNTILGDCLCGGNLVEKNGFLVGQLSATGG